MSGLLLWLLEIATDIPPIPIPFEVTPLDVLTTEKGKIYPKWEDLKKTFLLPI